MNAGNDDPAEIDQVLEASDWVQFLEGHTATLPDGTEMASCGYANRTPWDCPRDVEENDLARRLETAISGLEDPGEGGLQLPLPAVRHRHRCRPKAGREPSDDLGAGGAEMHPSAAPPAVQRSSATSPSLACTATCTSPAAAAKLGRTVCLNPGSEYNEGILRGALVELRKGASPRPPVHRGLGLADLLGVSYHRLRSPIRARSFQARVFGSASIRSPSATIRSVSSAVSSLPSA